MSDKLVLYGAGRFGVFAALVLFAAGEAPFCFCDKKTSGYNEPITELPIISPQTLKSDYPNSKIIITAFMQTHVDEINMDLEALGIDRSKVSQFYSLHDTIMHNDELINYISRNDTYLDQVIPSITILSSVLKNDLEIKGDILRLKEFYFPYNKRAYCLFRELVITLLTYLSGISFTRKNIGIVDSLIERHSYLLDDVDVPMMINRNDVVIDAGAWIGDFSLLAAKGFGAKVYAFEPSNANYEELLRTIAINGCDDKIIAIKSGLGKCAAQSQLKFDWNGSRISDQGDELITVTTIDDFVTEKQIDRVDFIKADIEGYEREMIIGATKTLCKFAPKLSLCSYHLWDDPVVLRELISKANPAYKFEQRVNMLFAWA